jgi:PleD family two-component response regulator
MAKSIICLVIYDVTDVATNRHQLQAANAQLQQLSRTDRLTGFATVVTGKKA